MVVVRAGSKSVCLVLSLLLAGSGCGYEGKLPTPTRPPSPPVPPTQAEIVLTLSSSPIDAVVSVDGGAPWSADWILTVQETAGIGGNIDFVRAILADTAGGPIAETELDADQVGEQLGGSTHIQGGSNQQVLMGLNFGFPPGVLSGDLRVTVQLRDDRGNTVSASVDDVIQICVPRLLAPPEGELLDNGCTKRDNGILWEFDWSDCPGAEAYGFYLKQRNAEEPIIDRSDLGASSYTVLEDRVIPEESRLGWFWKVRAKLNGVWSDWSPERDFDVEPANTDCVNP